jgi:formylmethanofuran dehydrogenase subunit E
MKTIEQQLESLCRRLKELEDTIEYLTKDMPACESCGGLDISEEAQQITDDPICERCVDQRSGR